jgi:hypothetical protein
VTSADPLGPSMLIGSPGASSLPSHHGVMQLRCFGKYQHALPPRSLQATPRTPTAGPTPAPASTCLRRASTSTQPAAALLAARSSTIAPTPTPLAHPWPCRMWQVRCWPAWVARVDLCMQAGCALCVCVGLSHQAEVDVLPAS